VLISSPEHWRELVIAYFQYVLMLKDSALPFYLFQEHQALSSIRFTHRDKSNSDAYVRAISSNLQRPFPVHRVLTAPLLLWKWEEGKVREVLDLVDIRKCRVIVCANDLSKVVSEPSWLRERWYGTEYRVEPLDTTTISQSLGVQPSFGFFVPRPNQFIPELLHIDRPRVEASQVRPITRCR
jgi:insulysin